MKILAGVEAAPAALKVMAPLKDVVAAVNVPVKVGEAENTTLPEPVVPETVVP